MWSATKEKSNPLSSRDDVIRAVTTMLSALGPISGRSGAVHARRYLRIITNIAGMEGFRALWGLFPLWAGGEETPFAEKYIQAIKLGTDPDSPSIGAMQGHTISGWWRWRPTAWAWRYCRRA
jgi:hypothetical protein